MQRSYDLRTVSTEDFPQLKKMWCDIFGDPRDVVDNFFDKTVQADNIIAVFYGEEIVSALYLLDSTICVNGKAYDAYYVYGVSTKAEHRGKGLMKKCLARAEKKAVSDNVNYLFLVPAQDSLFPLYEKSGYRTGFYNLPCELHKKEYAQCDYPCTKLTFNEYEKYRHNADFTVATLGEKTFESFYNPVGRDVKIISVEGEGYAAVEMCDGKCVVYEVFGNESVVISKVFDVVNCNTLTLNRPSAADGIPCGMYLALGDAPEFADGFFGIPYGG